MKIKIGPCFFKNSQKIHVNKKTNIKAMYALREYTGYEKKVLCAVFELKLNAAINYQDLNQGSADKICDSLFESIAPPDIMEKIAEIAEKENIFPEDPCCFRAAIYITINGKQMPFLTDFKIEKVKVEGKPGTPPYAYSYDPSPEMEGKLWRFILDENLVRNSELRERRDSGRRME